MKLFISTPDYPRMEVIALNLRVEDESIHADIIADKITLDPKLVKSNPHPDGKESFWELQWDASSDVVSWYLEILSPADHAWVVENFHSLLMQQVNS